jgi:hypothetical protein
MIDLGGWMLMRFTPGGGSQRQSAWRTRIPLWLGLSVGQVGADWHALRVALYASRAETGPAQAAGRSS